MYPGQTQQSILRFTLPSTVKEGTYTYPLSVLTKTGKKKTIVFTVHAGNCPFSALIQHEPVYTVSACTKTKIPLSVFPIYLNQSLTNVSFNTSFAYQSSINSIKVSSHTENATLTLDIPCDVEGETPLTIAMKYGSILRNASIPIKILPYAFQSLSFTYPKYTICTADKAYLPLTVRNDDTKNHTLSLKTSENIWFLGLNQTKLTLDGKKQTSITLIVDPDSTFAKEGTITITAKDERGAVKNTTVDLDFVPAASCEKPEVNIPVLEFTVEDNKSTNIPITLAYSYDAYYNQPKEAEYTLSVSPKYSFVQLEESTVTVDGNKSTTLSLTPTGAYSAKYPLTLTIASEHSTTKIPLTVIVTSSPNGTFWSKDNMLLIYELYGAYALVGLVLGLIIILLLYIFLPAPIRKQYSIIPQEKEKTIEEQKRPSSPPSSVSIPSYTSVQEQEHNLNTEEEMRRLLLTIEVEKKAREKIINDLSDWSKQYASVKESYDKNETLKLKTQAERDKEYKEINELLAVQKDSYAKLHAREQQIKNKLETKTPKGFFSSVIDFFTPEDKYVDLREVGKKKQKTEKKQHTKKPSDEISKENKKSIQRLKQRKKKGFWKSVKEFFMDDE